MQAVAAILLIGILVSFLDAAPANVEANAVSAQANNRPEAAIKEANSAMQLLGARIQEYTDKMEAQHHLDKEGIQGILDAKNKLEIALKSLTGGTQRADEATVTGLHSAMAASINDTTEALNDLNIKQAKKLREITADNKGKPIEEQEQALKQFAEKQGEDVKEAVNGVLAAREKVESALKEHVKEQVKGMPEEGRKAGDQLMEVISDKKASEEDKMKKMEEIAAKLPEPIKEQLHVKNTAEVKEFIQNAEMNLGQLVDAGLRPNSNIPEARP